MIRQKKAFRSLETEAIIALIFTADRVKEMSDRLLREYSLSMEQYNVLRILRGAGEEGLRTGDVVERMITRSPNITRLVDKLERRGCLSRNRPEKDRRVIRLRIEEAGLALLEKLDAPIDRIDAELMAGLNREETLQLVELLEGLCGPILEGLGEESDNEPIQKEIQT